MGLKIAMITPWKKKCGIYTYSRDLVDALAEAGVAVYIVPLPRFGTKTADIMATVANKIPYDEIDLIHVQHEHGLYVNMEETFYGTMKQTGKPIITTMHAVGNFHIDPYLSRTSDLVIVHNEFCKSNLHFPCKIIPHGCKIIEPMDKEEAKVSVGVDPRASLVGYVGFISVYKGLETLIKAMTKVPRAGLLIGGGWHTGPSTTYIHQLKQMTTELLPNRHQWIGFVPEEKLATVYSAMDLVVYPSVFSTESGALLMALGHGKAVIARQLSPFVEKSKVGALCTFKTERALVRKIKRLLRNDTERRDLEEGAKAYCKENSWANIAKLHIQEYMELLGSEA